MRRQAADDGFAATTKKCIAAKGTGRKALNDLQSTDVERLQDALALPAAFKYRDFGEQTAVAEALRRWPLLSQLVYARQVRPGKARA